MNLREKQNIKAPIAEKNPTILTKHGDVRIDDYYWMKLSDEQKMAEKPDQHTSKVVEYLEEENKYREDMTSHLEGFQETLFEEIKGRIKQDDTSVPYKSNGYFYITRYETGQEYPIYSRKKENLDNAEEIMLDVNEMAKAYSYYNVSARKVSIDNKILAYGEDTVSRRQYTLRFKNLVTGEMYDDKITNTTGTAVWANDNQTIFYTRKDDALRSFKIFKHILGTDEAEDVEVFHEKDETFNAFVYKTKSNKYIVIGSWATLSQEFYTLSADSPNDELTLFQRRERKLEYSIAHYDDKWFIRTNKDGARNFKIMTTSEDATSQDNWKDLIAHREDVFVEGLDLFNDYMVVNERIEGISKMRIMPWGEDDHYIDFGEAAYTSSPGVNMEFDTEILRVGFTSMTTPSTVYDYDMKSRKLELMKQQEVIGDFKPEDYESERIMVEARDGVNVPVSIVYKKGFKKDGSQPLLLYAYGSYGYSIDPYFSSVRLSLLDRGFGYAIAHIRGGQELGRDWYENGKFLKKMNTFTDFIDVGEYLVNQKYVAKNQLYAMGGSAGGMLMGGIANMRPELWAGIVAAVPFVDVVTTMLDDTIPLTTGEYDEWGNPNDEIYYRYMKSYSPLDNVEAKDYPSILITTGYHDSQVQYWEPAKWIAKLRDLKTDNNPLIMYCNMDTGHGGASGRFQKYKEVAMEYAYLLDLAGKVNK
jgi:oligopeptidase B